MKARATARARAVGALLTGLVALGAWGASSCSPSSFQSATVIDTVRILASRASEPRAKPGDNVTVDVLTYDGRLNPTTPMHVSWLPLLCVNPAGDAYYACFQGIAAIAGGGGSGDAGIIPVSVASAMVDEAGVVDDAGVVEDAGTGTVGGDGGLTLMLRPGVSLPLVSGPSFSFRMPSNVVVARTGASPYGLIILFNFACAGQLALLPYDPNSQNPQQIPLGCFDSNGNQLGADDFVFGFTRIYAEVAPTEVNPVITQVDVGSSLLDVDGGVAIGSFDAAVCEGDADTCAHRPIGPVVPPSPPSTKQVWADFYATAGTFGSEARLLYDPMTTLDIPKGTDNEYISPNSLSGAPASNFIWIVVHDDQGGADWVRVNLQLK